MSDLIPRDKGLKPKKRIGRGESSGHGKTSTRGHKGQRARAGAKIPVWFEGGQMPLTRRLPKIKGFRPLAKVKYQVVNLSKISRFVPPDRTEVDPAVMHELGMISSLSRPVKILADGSLKRPLQVVAHSFSKSAIEAIQKAGGKAITLTK